MSINPHQTADHLDRHTARPRYGPALPPYVYQPLEDPDHQIRLMRLLPGDSPNLHITLEIVEFGDGTGLQYEALSYTWGSQENLASVRVDGPRCGPRCATLLVTRNLQEALYKLRLKNEARVLWIDAICINQADLIERSKQLILMPPIYENARRVVAWLGPASFDSNLAFDCFQMIKTHIVVDHTRRRLYQLSIDGPWSTSLEILPFDDVQLWALCNFLHRPWFERLWIWQEIRLGAKRAVLLCGERSLSWTEFRDAVTVLDSIALATFPASERLGRRTDAIHQLALHAHLPLFNAMESARWCKCSDERDRIFTALILDRDGGADLGIRPDYIRSVQEVYTEAVVKHLERSYSLDFLICVERNQRVPGLPSWVPDWSATKNASTLYVSYAAASSRSAAYVSADNVLLAKGIAVTRIAESLPFDGLDDLSLQIGQMDVKLVELENHLVENENAVGRHERSAAFCRVLTQNQVPERDMLSREAVGELYVRDILGMGDQVLSEGRRQKGRYIIHRHCVGRSLCVSDKHHICLAPGAALPGDIVAVLLGCTQAIILRPNADGTHRVIGEAYCDGIMDGEAVLGPLPKDTSILALYDGENATTEWVFRDDNTGETSLHDPRLPELPLDWEEVAYDMDAFYLQFRHRDTGVIRTNHDDPRCDIDALEKRGLRFEEFALK